MTRVVTATSSFTLNRADVEPLLVYRLFLDEALRAFWCLETIISLKHQ